MNKLLNGLVLDRGSTPLRSIIHVIYKSIIENLQKKRGFYMRGMLTDNIQEKAVTFLNREISQKELRLYPYIDYSIKNACQGWSYLKMDEEEIKILNRLYDEGHIIYSPEKVIVTRSFYNFMQDILASGYVEEFI